MTTIDYKEKYEQALERAKYYHDRDNIQFLENIFPELAEREDEKIRSALLRGFNSMYANQAVPTFAGEPIKDILAWLEKQGMPAKYHDICDTCVRQPTCQSDCFLQQDEQKPTTWSEEDEMHIRELERLVKQVWAIAEHENNKDTIHKMSDLSFFLKTLKPQLKQDEQKPVVDTKVIIPKFRVGDIVKSKSQPMLSPRKIISIGKDCYWCEDRGCIGFAWEDDCEIVEQNPAWSEEDVAMLDSAIAFVEHSAFTTIGKGKNNVIAWLKSIRDKAQPQPQPRQELSEEDKRIIDDERCLPRSKGLQ